jgi:hypothetical protein
MKAPVRNVPTRTPNPANDEYPKISVHGLALEGPYLVSRAMITGAAIKQMYNGMIPCAK